MKDCCHSTNKDTKCVRKSDGKAFDLPRKYSKQYCLSKKNKGFTQRSSCAPYNDCNKKGGAKNIFYLIQMIQNIVMMFMRIQIQVIRYLLNIQLLKMLKIQ